MPSLAAALAAATLAVGTVSGLSASPSRHTLSPPPSTSKASSHASAFSSTHSHASAPSCGASSFNISLLNIQCFGLENVPSAATEEACVAACCASPACVAWEFCPPGQSCTSFTGPSCWTGQTDTTKCAAGEGWTGGARATPTPSPPLPQRFLGPLPHAVAPLASVDLGGDASGGLAWTASVDGAPARPIYVPAGGYNSDEQEQPWIDSYSGVLAGVALTATLPPLPPLPSPLPWTGVTWLLELGACNHGCELYLNGSLVGVHHGPNMPFSADVTGMVAAPQLHLTVLARPFTYYGGLVPSTFRYAETWTHPAGGFSSRTPGGVSKWIRLVAVPSVRIADIVTRASVSSQTLTVLVEFANSMAVDAEVTVTGTLSSWNFGGGGPQNASEQPWGPYPPVQAPASPLLVPAGATNATLTLTVNWQTLGPASWWWPNRPFDPNYFAQLHWLNLTAAVTPAASSSSSAAAAAAAPPSPALLTASHRFGFVEHAEGGPFFYTLNGVRVNQLSDATPEQGMSFYDAYASPAFQYPDNARDTWRRYMRLGITSNRIHQSTPTQGMMDAADEVGFLLKPESPTRGCTGYEPCASGSPIFAQSVGELVRWSRAHPSVAAYSVENEAVDDAFITPNIDAAFAADPTRPLTTEGSGGAVIYNGTLDGAHAVNYLHYQVPSRAATSIRAVGECAWCVANGLESFSSLALAGRLNDVVYYAGWDLLNYWSNFLLGMNASRHAWTQVPCQGRDRVDGPDGDGWGSPVVDWVQAAFRPFLVAAPAVVAANPVFTGPGWPYVVDAYAYPSPSPLNLTVSLFNDVLASTYEPWLGAGSPLSGELALNVTLAWDSPTGPDAAGGAVMTLGPFAVAPGFRVDNVSVPVPVPDPGAGAQNRRLYTVLASFRPADTTGAALYVEDRLYVTVSRA